MEVKQDPIPEKKEGAVMYEAEPAPLGMRPRVSVSLGVHVINCARPKADPLDPRTTQAGVLKRAAKKPPPICRQTLRAFKRFVDKWIRHNMTPLAADVDTSVEKWLSRTDYPEWRKKELLTKWEDVRSIFDPAKRKRYYKCTAFMKDESYESYKHPRGIYSRSDEFKCAVGPIFKLIEEEMYSYRAFIKHVPVARRPDYIMGLLHREGAKYLATDYTAFESLFVRELMLSCEFQLYSYMTKFLPDGLDFMDLVNEVIGGQNVCVFKRFRVKIDATRMSGEMCTSLGNGFSNLMFMLFTCERVGCTEVEGVVEGDDGLFTMRGTPPTKEDFAKLGLDIKAVVHDTISTASFCGIVFDPDDRVNVADPSKVFANFGWAPRRYARARDSVLRVLLRCKALSLAHQYPGCPMLQELAQYALRVTSDVPIDAVVYEITRKGFDWNEKRLVFSAIKEGSVPFREPPMNTRLLMETLYGYTVEQQLHIEAYLRSLTTIQPLDDHVLVAKLPLLWGDYFSAYATREGRLDRDMEFPAMYIGTLKGLTQEWVDTPRPKRYGRASHC